MRTPALALLAILSLPAAACDLGQVSEEEDLEDNEVQSFEWSHDPGLGLYAEVRHYADSDLYGPWGASAYVRYYDDLGNSVDVVPHRIGVTLELWADCGSGWWAVHRTDQASTWGQHGADVYLDGDFGVGGCRTMVASWAGVYGADEWDNFYQSWEFSHWDETFPYWE